MMNIEFDPAFVTTVFAALFLGGIVKGATGAGTPLVAVPVIAVFLDVRVAVIIMIIPNMVTNLWQLWQFHDSHLPDRFGLRFAIGGAIGVAAGTALLAYLPAKMLTVLVTVVIISYVLLRLARPGFRLEWGGALRMVPYMGVAGGVLQGAAGIAAPVAVSFLNAVRLERPQFIATISLFFASIVSFQFVSLLAYQLFTPAFMAYSLAAVLPLLVALPIGSWLGQKLSAAAFDKALLVLLTVIAMRLAYTLFG